MNRALAWSLGIVLALVVLWVAAFPVVFWLRCPSNLLYEMVDGSRRPYSVPIVRPWIYRTSPGVMHGGGPSGFSADPTSWPYRVWWPLCRGWAKWKGWG